MKDYIQLELSFKERCLAFLGFIKKDQLYIGSSEKGHNYSYTEVERKPDLEPVEPIKQDTPVPFFELDKGNVKTNF